MGVLGGRGYRKFSARSNGDEKLGLKRANDRVASAIRFAMCLAGPCFLVSSPPANETAASGAGLKAASVSSGPKRSSVRSSILKIEIYDIGADLMRIPRLRSRLHEPGIGTSRTMLP